MLTLANVRNFRNDLKSLEAQCDELLKVRERQKIFDNFDDMSDGLLVSEKVPQDYFKFQLFHFYIELNKDNKGYYIYAENYRPRDSELLAFRVGLTNQYRFPIDFTFTAVKSWFVRFCVDMCHNFSNDFNDQLFYIY